MSILEEIQEGYINFSDKEKMIATYLLQNSETIANINISELARLTHSSPSSITRFAKKVNCQSFVDLKIKLNMTSPKKKHFDEGKTNKVYDFYNKVIENTKEMTNPKEIEQVVRDIHQAERILVLGVGSSGLTATELTQRLLRMGLNVTAITDPHFMIISSSIAKEKDLVIGISTSGETVEVVNSLNLAKQTGAKIVSLTSFSGSRVAMVSETSLIAYSSLFVDNKRFVNSQFAMMYLVDIMTTLLLEDPNLNRNMDRTIAVITQSIEENIEE